MNTYVVQGGTGGVFTLLSILIICPQIIHEKLNISHRNKSSLDNVH